MRVTDRYSMLKAPKQQAVTTQSQREPFIFAGRTKPSEWAIYRKNPICYSAMERTIMDTRILDQPQEALSKEIRPAMNLVCWTRSRLRLWGTLLVMTRGLVSIRLVAKRTCLPTTRTIGRRRASASAASPTPADSRCSSASGAEGKERVDYGYRRKSAGFLQKSVFNVYERRSSRIYIL